MSADGRRPPRLATWLVERVVPPGSSRDGLLGDMEERFRDRARESLAGARARYWSEAVESVARYAMEGVRVRISAACGGGVDGWLRDVRFALRRAWRRPAFAALLIGTLALGIGANAAVFSVVHAVLLESLPYQAPERLVMADQLQRTGFRAAVSMPNYEDWRDRSTLFDGFAMEKPESLPVGGREGVEVLEGRMVLGDFFELFGVPPVVGALPSAEELGPGAERIVVLTHGLWQRRFGGREDVVGEKLRIAGESYEVVAVLPADFVLDDDVAFYVPLGRRAADPAWRDRSTSYGGWVVARMRPGVTLEEARNDLARVTRELRSTFGGNVAGAAVFSMREWHVGEVRQPLVLLMMGVSLVLVVACANVASLLLGRSEERRSEFAVRAALGGARGRLVRELLAETLVLGVAGTLAGILLAKLTLDGLLVAVGPSLPAAFAERVAIDGPVVAVTSAVSLAVILLFGLVPALQASRTMPARALRRAVGVGAVGARLRGLLVGGEVALSVVLLVCAGLLVRSVFNLSTLDKGFSAEGVLAQRITAPSDRYPDREAALRAHERIRREVRRLPDVTHVASSNLFPFSRTNWEMRFRTRDGQTSPDPESVLYSAVTPDYFDVFSVELLRGRLFTEEDRADAEPVVVIDETAAERHWPDEDPVGHLVSVDDVREGDEFVPRWRRIVGVVEHVRNYELTEPSRIEAYVPLSQSVCCRTLWLTVRGTGDAEALAPAVRETIRGVDPEMPIFRVNTMRAVIEGETVTHRTIRTMFSAFGVLTLVLGAVGIYGVVSSGVASRRREIGLRIALGSVPARAAATVTLAGLVWVGVGVSVGLVAAPLAGRILQSLLVEVSPLDPMVVGGSAGVLVLAALLAAWLPARGAVRLDPATVLRDE